MGKFLFKIIKMKVIGVIPFLKKLPQSFVYAYRKTRLNGKPLIEESKNEVVGEGYYQN